MTFVIMVDVSRWRLKFSEEVIFSQKWHIVPASCEFKLYRLVASKLVASNLIASKLLRALKDVSRVGDGRRTEKERSKIRREKRGSIVESFKSVTSVMYQEKMSKTCAYYETSYIRLLFIFPVCFKIILLCTNCRASQWTFFLYFCP